MSIINCVNLYIIPGYLTPNIHPTSCSVRFGMSQCTDYNITAVHASVVCLRKNILSSNLWLHANYFAPLGLIQPCLLFSITVIFSIKIMNKAHRTHYYLQVHHI